MVCGVSKLCNCLQQFVATVLLVVQPMGTARNSMILHVCNCFSSCSQNFHMFVFTLISSQSLLKIFANLNSYLVTHSMSNPSDSLSNSPNFAVLPRGHSCASPTNGSWWGSASTCSEKQRSGVPACSPACSCQLQHSHKFVSPLPDVNNYIEE